MALTFKNEKEEAAAQAAQAAQAAKEEEVKAKAAAAAAPEAPAGVLGTKSDKIVLIAPLGDPSREDRTPRKVGDKEDILVTPTIVGFQFKVLEDMDIPECGLGDDAKTNPMSYKDMNGIKHAKAGETINLTRFETGLLLSQECFNAKVSGENRNFLVVYQSGSATPKATDGSVAKATSPRLPTVSLRGIETSIKDLPMINVLNYTAQASQDGKSRVITSRTIVPGFEKWEPLTRATVRRPSVPSAGTSDRVERNKNAQLFLQMVSKRRG